MRTKHKLLQNYQFVSPEKKIFTLKVGTILENYLYNIKNESIPIDKEVVDSNPEYFELLDYKSELLSFIKFCKIPQPSQVHKKILPFIEDILLSNQSAVSIDPIVDIKRESELNRRERAIKDREDEIELKNKRIDKRESDYRDEVILLDKRDSDLRKKSKELLDKSIDLDEKLQELNEKGRNIDVTNLKSSEEIDARYTNLREKINKDLESLSKREKDLDIKSKELKKQEIELYLKSNRERDLLIDEIKYLEVEIRKISVILSSLNDFAVDGGPANHPQIILFHKEIKELINGLIDRINNNLV